jgi:D-3-phosphoglycerate dehydrogenase
MKILFIDTAHPFLIQSLRNAGHECLEAYTYSRAEIERVIGDFDGIVIRSRIVLDGEILSLATDLKFIARAGAGMESIDVKFASAKNIYCFNSPEGNRDAVGEHAAGMLLSLMNNLSRADREVREGKWNREENRGHELQGKTVGLIGFGNMGSAFAGKLSGFGCKILAYDKYRSGFGTDMVKEATMEELYRLADIVSLHVPLTIETEYLVNDEFLSRFKKNIYLVNTARGKCVRTNDLVRQLQSGKITGACLDVLEYEELSFEKFSIADIENNPDWKYIIASSNVILSPHIAGWTYESLEKIARVLYEKITALQIP